MSKKRKPGWKTTEFWAACVLPVLGSIFLSLKGSLPPKWALLCVCMSNGCYAISRGLTNFMPENNIVEKIKK